MLFILSCGGGSGGGGSGGAAVPVNQPPVVDAGPDQSVTLAGGAALGGTVADDGLPNPPGGVTALWSQASGPGTATFADPSSPATTAAFSQEGTYVLRLTAGDGELSASDDLTVSVTSAAVPPTITTQPANRTVIEGQTATFTVVATGTAPLGYQWQRDGLDIPGATSGTYTTSATTLADSGATFRVTVSNAQGTVGSSPATLTVQPMPPPPTCCGTIPNFAQNPTIRSTGSGDWSNPTTWDLGRVPGPTDVALIASGSTVTVDTMTGQARVVGIQANAVLRFPADRDTRLTVGTLLVMPGGTLEGGTPAAPVNPNVVLEIVIADQSLDLANDPDQFGTGLVGLGKVTLHGAVKAPTFVRLGQEPRAGDTTLALSQPVSGWRPGDRLFLPDTRHLLETEKWANYVPQWETASVQSVSPSGTSLTLSGALGFEHPGARDGDNRLDFLPHVMNLSRNVVIRSENPGGTRGHTLFSEMAEVDIRYVQFQDMGRTTNAALDPVTNHIARYALHMHHLMGPMNMTNTGYQFQLVGNAVADSTKWPITIHNSHYGLIQGNTVYNGQGAGIVTEDGNESYNEFLGNFAAAIVGDENPRDNDGRDGSVFWLHGWNSILRDNVAANGINHFQGAVPGSGYNFIWSAASTRNTPVPLFRGADLENGTEGVDYELVNMQLMPIREFARNEAYGATAVGVVIWRLGSDGGSKPEATQVTVLRDFSAWHVHDQGFFAYPIKNVTFDGFVVRGHPRALGAGSGWASGDYYAENVTIRRANVQGMGTGVGGATHTPGTFTIEDSYFRVFGAGVYVEIQKVPGGGGADEVLPRRWVIRNVRFDAWPGSPLASIWMSYFIGNGKVNLIQTDQVFVYDYQGVAGRNFQVFYKEQRPAFIVPQTSYNSFGQLDILGSPEAGLTNQENWARYGIAIAGAVSPTLDDTTHPEIEGYTIPIP
jgi:hypothetical protein